MDSHENWTPAILQSLVAAVLFAVGALMLARAKGKGWRWASPVAHAVIVWIAFQVLWLGAPTHWVGSGEFWLSLVVLVGGLGLLVYIESWKREEGLMIHYALYGLGSGQDLEVTECVRRLVTNGKLNIKVLPKTFLIDDPYPNKTKSLRVTCSYGDKERVEVQCTDYHLMNLPYDIDH